MKSKPEGATPTPREILSANLRRLIAAHKTLTSIKKVAEATADYRLNGEDVHLSNGKVGRIAAGSHTTDIDALYSLAKAFELQPWQLLVKDLNPSALPRLADESVLHQILEAVQRPAAALHDNVNSASPAHPLKPEVQPASSALAKVVRRSQGKGKSGAGSTAGAIQKPRAGRRS